MHRKHGYLWVLNVYDKRKFFNRPCHRLRYGYLLLFIIKNQLMDCNYFFLLIG
jgi:hypothetical protein